VIEGPAEIVGGVLLLGGGLAIASVYGAGWLAYQAGNLIYQSGKRIDEAIAEKQRLLRLEEEHRMQIATAARVRLHTLCKDFIDEISDSINNSSLAGGNADVCMELQGLRLKTRELLEAALPSEVAQLESSNSIALASLERMVHRKNELCAQGISSGKVLGELALADLIEDIKKTFSAISISEKTDGHDVVALPPNIATRVELHKQFSDVVIQIRKALISESERVLRYPVHPNDSEYLHVLFDGVDKRIERLSDPAVTNEELRNGIHRLSQILTQYNHYASVLERKECEFTTLYQVYEQAQRGLELSVRSAHQFKSVDDLKAELKHIERRIERAKICGQILKRLGKDAYLCYAFDEEMRALGYSVYSKRSIADKLQREPSSAMLGDVSLPVYEWGESKTQLYWLSNDCSVQLVIHPDGSTTLQTIADGQDSALVITAQEKHCSMRERLQKQLRENWFVSCNLDETQSPHVLYTEAQWRSGNKGTITENRKKSQSEKKYQTM